MKKLPKKDMLPLLKEWEDSFHKIDSIYEMITNIGLCPSDDFVESLYASFKAHTNLLAKMIGDKTENLSWYCYDNNMGKAKLKAGLTGKEKPIKNISDLADLILL